MLKGFGFSGYRSFGPDLQRIGPLAKVNFIAGPNNSGKSNILRYLTQQYPRIVKSLVNHQEPARWAGLDLPVGQTDAPRSVSLPFSVDLQDIEKAVRSHSACRPEIIPQTASDLYTLLTARYFTLRDGMVWFDLTHVPTKSFWTNDQLTSHILSQSDNNLLGYWKRAWGFLTGRTGGGPEENWIPEVLAWLYAAAARHGNFHLIPAFRQITPSLAAQSDPSMQTYNGEGLITELIKLERPDIASLADKAVFSRIEHFVRRVTRCDDAGVEIPHHGKTIHLTLHGRTLPIEHLGTGLHQVILFGALGTILRDSTLCLEEPETHLHPLFQRELVRYLRDHTDNQYIIATHSAHMLDLPEAAVFRIELQEKWSRVELTRTAADRFQICFDLGYRASDLLQSNCVVWVEGPSDRIYFLHWLKEVDPSLQEELHFSVMFYGGRLLRHLTANDSRVSEFISLRRLNRNVVMLIDSDRSKPDQGLSPTKDRVIAEIAEHGGIAWITQGRQIENYIVPEALNRAIRAVHPRYKGFKSRDRYANPFTTLEHPDKVAIAHEVVASPADLDRLDLRERMNAIALYIRTANHSDDLLSVLVPGHFSPSTQ